MKKTFTISHIKFSRPRPKTNLILKAVPSIFESNEFFLKINTGRRLRSIISKSSNNVSHYKPPKMNTENLKQIFLTKIKYEEENHVQD